VEMSTQSSNQGPLYHSASRSQIQPSTDPNRVSVIREPRRYDPDRNALEKLVSDLTLSVPLVLVMSLYYPVCQELSCHDLRCSVSLPADAESILARSPEGTLSSGALRLSGDGASSRTISFSGLWYCSTLLFSDFSSSMAGRDRVAMGPALIAWATAIMAVR
jgi:hypothetical protein